MEYTEQKITLCFDKESPQVVGSDIVITANNEVAEKCQYKFMAGIDGIWKTLKDFSDDNSCLWTPNENGRYLVMVQIKKEGSKRPFDEMVKQDFVIGSEEEKLIKSVYIDKLRYSVGEKIHLEAQSTKIPVMYRFWIDGKSGWQLLRDYGTENKIQVTCREPGSHEILVECKVPYSENNFDDFKTICFEVNDIEKLQITDYRCLTNDLLVGEDLVFQVETAGADERTILYKFIKINSDGKAICVQDFSSRKMVSFTEEESGEYKLLCLAKDMYSPREYDDRAIIMYEVIPYYPIKITNFTTDVSSPQTEQNKILIKAVAEGGKNLLYRFRIDGNYGEDSGYLRQNNYLWEAKQAGDYKISVYIKDESFKDEPDYEVTASFDFLIEKQLQRTVKIMDLTVDRDRNYLVNNPINIKVIAEGGTDLKYSFIVRHEGEDSEEIPYGNVNWVNFTPEESGEYQLEVRVKDKYSAKEFDAHSFLYFDVKPYMEGKIDHILIDTKEYYLVGDEISIESITENTKETLIKYVIKVDEMIIEETDFIYDKVINLKPKRAGKYRVEMYAKNIKCKGEFDSKREVKLIVSEAPPVTGTEIYCDNPRAKIDEEINFTINSQGGKSICYEFYIMNKGNWKLVQPYSRKNYYSFRPFDLGKYKLLVLAKSYYKKCSYEDYDTFEFNVDED